MNFWLACVLTIIISAIGGFLAGHYIPSPWAIFVASAFGFASGYFMYRFVEI